MQRRGRVLWAGWLVWAVVAAGGALVLARAELSSLRDDFETQARIAHRLLSQQVVQYDAVLSTLAMLAPSGDDRPETRLPTVYQSVLEVNRRLDGEEWPDSALELAEGESRSLRRAVVVNARLDQGRYQLLKAGRRGSYALRIDLAAAMVWRDWPMDPAASPVRLAIAHGGQSYVVQAGRQDAGLAWGRWVYSFSKPLASASQAFDVEAARVVAWQELPWAAMAGWVLGVSVLAGGLQAWWGQRVARRRAEELLRLGQVARLNSLGELAAGMAHELNQPLTAVMANTQAARRLLDEDPPELDTARGAMAQAAAQARRAADVVGRLRGLIEQPAGAGALQPVALHEAAERVLDLLEPECRRRDVAVPVVAQDAAVQVQADPVALEQIVHNLLMNALQALDGVPAAERRLALSVSREGGQGLLAVDDTGRGIAPEALPRLFEPFFSTRDGGLGLGLSLCETQAATMGGSLAAANRVPRGARFELRLPLAPGQQGQQA
ncbi:ATP-binding protein [Aquincola sp. MAHUQ-54]|uniref:histidine kinase n=1 Tax=Aquincola agrisoli TaxID=3119538 RepID=A0AAW9QJS2_9BURK